MPKPKIGRIGWILVTAAITAVVTIVVYDLTRRGTPS